MPKKNQIKKYLPLLLVLAFMGAAYLGGWHENMTLQEIQTQKDKLLKLTAEHFILVAGFYALGYILVVTLSLPVATLMTLLGGFLFGKWIGTLLVVISATIGATLIFLIARSALGQSLRERASSLYKKIQGNMQQNAVSYLLFLRLVPLFPFFLVNIAPAFFNISTRTFVLTTFFGIIPGSFVYVNLGQTLGDLERLDDLIAPSTLFAFFLLGLLALTPSIYRQLKKNKAKEPLS